MNNMKLLNLSYESLKSGITIRYARIDPNLPAFKEPTYNGDAGYDLYASKSYWVFPFKITKMTTNVCFEIPIGFFGRICGRSGHILQGKMVAAGTVDASYRGEVHVTMWSLFPCKIKVGQRIGQIIFMPCMVNNQMIEVQPEELSTTARGDKGFNSTGIE